MQEQNKLTLEEMELLVAKEKELEAKALEGTVHTKVTSIAEQNKNGANIKLPTSEQIVTRAGIEHIKHKQLFNDLFKDLSARAKQRVMNALLELPAENMRSLFKDKAEYETFNAGQTALNYKFIILTHHIGKLAKETKVSEENTDKNVSTNLGEQSNVESTNG